MDTVHAADYFYQRHLVYLCPLEETGGDDIPAKGRNPCENDNLSLIHIWDSCYFYYTYALELAREKQYPSEVSILHELGILYLSLIHI